MSFFVFLTTLFELTASNDVQNCGFVLQVAKNHSDLLYERNAPLDQYKKKEKEYTM